MGTWVTKTWRLKERIKCTRGLRDIGAMLYQLSYEATNWEWGQL